MNHFKYNLRSFLGCFSLSFVCHDARISPPQLAKKPPKILLIYILFKFKHAIRQSLE